MNPFADADGIRLARVVPWSHTLDPADYRIDVDRLSEEVEQQIRERVHRYGICQVRMSGYPPSTERLLSLEYALGPACERQNDYEGKIKTIIPDPDKEANSGDSAKELAVHVDGTQDEMTPAMLVFQYAEQGSFLAHSTFVDLTTVFANLPAHTLEEVLVTLADSKCAIIEKKGLRYEGPLVVPVCQNQSISCRLRFDDVIEVQEHCREAFEVLRDAIFATEPLLLRPREGDLIIFDNWRVLHGRKEVGGRHRRVHDRMWIKNLRAPHDATCRLGLRPVTPELVTQIRVANDAA